MGVESEVKRGRKPTEGDDDEHDLPDDPAASVQDREAEC